MVSGLVVWLADSVVADALEVVDFQVSKFKTLHRLNKLSGEIEPVVVLIPFQRKAKASFLAIGPQGGQLTKDVVD